MYQIERISESRIEELIGLFTDCFIDDPYYCGLFPHFSDRRERIRKMAAEPVAYCVSQAGAYCIEQGGTLAAFFLCFDYQKLRHENPGMFNRIFSGNNKKNSLPYKKELHEKVERLGESVIYMLSIGVRKDLRQKGMAGALIDFLVSNYPCHHLAGDVSNEASLTLYRKRGFQEELINKGYFFIHRKSTFDLSQMYFDDEIYLVLPGAEFLEETGGGSDITDINLSGYAVQDKSGYRSFVKSPGNTCEAIRVKVSPGELLKYQRYINICNYTEEYISLDPPTLVYVQSTNISGRLLWNDTLREMVKSRVQEWNIVPDVEILIPIEYESLDCLEGFSGAYSPAMAVLIRLLDFRTHLEAGVPKSSGSLDPSSFKNRIKRFYLGRFKLKITAELEASSYESLGRQIGAAAEVDIMVSADSGSHSGVLSIISLSAPFLMSHLLDCTIRNQLLICERDKEYNLFDYVGEWYKIVKRGSPKTYLLIPEEKKSLDNNYIASLLMSETIYSSDEEFGKFTDRAVLDTVESEYGMGQYDRAFLCISSNVLLQIGGLSASVKARLYEESIAFFYMELLSFEEASIQIAEANIRLNLSKTASTASIKSLRNTLKIHKEYARTIEFWDIQMNYPSSKRSVSQIRNAFGLDDLLARMKRDSEEMQIVFDTQTEIMDRVESSILNYIMLFLTVVQVASILTPWLFEKSDLFDSRKLIGTGLISTLVLLFWWIKRIFLK